MDSLLIPPRDGIDIGDYTLRDFAAKWLMQQCDLAEVSVYREANRALLAGEDRRQRVVFMGDSITEFWTDLAELQTESVAIVNRGIRGQNSSQMLLRSKTMPSPCSLHASCSCAAPMICAVMSAMPAALLKVRGRESSAM